eukprot:6290426-Prymnesium_polylepis.1
MGRSLASSPKGCSISIAICSTLMKRNAIIESTGGATQLYAPTSAIGSVTSHRIKKKRRVAT